MKLREFDARWMKEQPAEHRAVRMTAVRSCAAHLERLYQQSLAGAKAGSGSQRGKSAAGGGGERRAPRALAAAPAPASRHAPQQQQQQQQQPQGGGMDRWPQQRQRAEQPAATAAAAAAALAVPKRKPAAAAGAGGYGLIGSKQPQPANPHLPSSAADMRALLGRAMGDPGGVAASGRLLQQQQQQQATRPLPEQQASPQKRLRSPHGAAAMEVSPYGGGATPQSDIVVLLSSPDDSPSPYPAASKGLDAARSPPLAQRLDFAAAAARQERQQQQQQPAPAAAQPLAGGEDEVVDLTAGTPPRTALATLPLAPAPAQLADAMRPGHQRRQQKGGGRSAAQPAAVLPSSPIDLTLDSD